MAEDLVVTLGLQDKGASKQVTALNKELRYLDKEFKSTTKTSKGYEQGTATLQRQLGILEKKYQANELKLKAYRQKMEETKAGINKKKEALVTLTSAEEVNERAVQKATAQIQQMEQTLRMTEREIASTENEMEELNEEIQNTNKAIKTKPLDDYRRKMEEMGARVEATGEKFKAYGEKMSSMGDKILGWTAPFTAVGIAGAKLQMDFRDNIENINTLLDDDRNLRGYENAVKRLSNETGLNMSLMTDGMYQAISSLGDAGAETEKIFNLMTRGAKAGKSEVSDAVALISAGMKGFGSVNEETARKISDLAFQTAKLGVTTFPEMAKSMQPLFPLASSLGISLEELFGVMATGTGVVGNTSEVSTQFKAVMSNLLKPTTDMAKVIKKYGFASGSAMIETKGFTGMLEILKKETGGSSAKMAKLFSSTEALTLMTALAGEQFEVFKDKNSAMMNSMGATDKAYEKVASTTKDKLIRNFNKLKNSIMEVGEKLMPMVDTAVEGLGRFADWLGKLDAGTIKTIASITMWGMALGTTLKIGGGVARNIGDITILFGKLIPKLGGATKEGGLFSKMLGLIGRNKSTAQTMAGVTEGATNVAKASKTAGGLKGLGALIKSSKLFNPIGLAVAGTALAVGTAMKVSKTNTELYAKSSTTAYEELSTFEKVVAKFNGTTFKTRKELEELNLVNKGFSDGISDEFKKAVETAEQKATEFKFQLGKMNADGVISNDDKKQLTASVKELCDGAINTIKSKTTEHKKALEGMFSYDGVVSKEEKKVLESLQKISNEEIKEVEKRKKQILAIVEKAKKDKRELNDKERADIIAHQEEIRRIELEQLGQTEEEKLFAKNEFTARMKNLTMQEATEMLQQKKKEIDENKVQIQASYDTEIELLQGKLSKMNEKDRANAEKVIENLQKDKADKLGIEDSLWAEYFGIAMAGNENLQGLINKFNGEELTKADIKKQELLNKWTTQYAELDKINKSGSYRLLNTQTGMYEELEIVVDSATGEIIGAYNHQKNMTAGYTDEMAQKARELGKEHQTASSVIQQAFAKSGQASVDGAGTIRDSSGRVVGALKDVKKNADGTAKAIINLNGEDVEIETNADGTIKDMEAVKKSIDNIPAKKEVSIFQRVKNFFTGESDGGNGKSRSMPNPSFGDVPSEGITLANIPTLASEGFSFTPAQRDLPTAFDTMITDPSFYSRSNPRYNAGQMTAPVTTAGTTQAIDYALIGEVIGKAVAEAVANLKIEPSFKAEIDGKEITTTVSTTMANNYRGRRR